MVILTLSPWLFGCQHTKHLVDEKYVEVMGGAAKMGALTSVKKSGNLSAKELKKCPPRAAFPNRM